MQPVNFRSFKRKLYLHRKSLRSFINKTAKNPPPGLDQLTSKIEPEVWKEIDCLSCANCCKTMTPTYNTQDIKRIAAHLGMSRDAFKKTYLKKQGGDYINKKSNGPCPFLNLENNKCTIYTVRPADCAGFPHLSKRRWKDYAHVHRQNIDHCPATYKMIEKMKTAIEEEQSK